MKNILMLFFAIAILHASTEDTLSESWQKRENAVTKSLCVIHENFLLYPLKQELAARFAEALAPTFADEKTMKYVGVGKTYTSSEVQALFSRLAQRMYSEAKITNYNWVLVIDKRPCGLVQALQKAEGMYESVLILSPSVQGRGLAQEIAFAISEFLPDVSWMATVDPKNSASISAIRKNRFEYKETKYLEAYKADRHIFVRPSKTAAIPSKL